MPRTTKSNGGATKPVDPPDINLNINYGAAFESMVKVVNDARNAAYSRAYSERKSLFSPRTDMNDECGYPTTENLNIQLFSELYKREAIAARVVDVLPDESWVSHPTIVEDEDPEVTTPFEKAIEELAKTLRGESWLEQETSNPIWEVLHRLDRLSGIGRYGVLLLGLDDGAELSAPATTAKGVLFLRVLDESQATIDLWNTDRTDRRYMQPEQYSVVLDDRTGSKSVKVHWTRVIHIADNLTSNEVYGAPRMRPVYNRLWDLVKLYSGSAEMYWQGAFPGISVETMPEIARMGQKVTTDAAGARTEIEKVMTGLQRYWLLNGLTVKTIAPTVADPSAQIEAQLDALCIRLGIPKRIFVGSERGELASSQDDKAWEKRMKRRRNNYIIPRIIAPFLDRLILLGALPQPTQYRVDWEETETLTEEQKASVLEKRTNAMAKYVGGGCDSLMDPQDYLSREMGYEEDEAKTIAEQASTYQEEQQAEEEAAYERQEALLPTNPPTPGGSNQPIPPGAPGK